MPIQLTLPNFPEPDDQPTWLAAWLVRNEVRWKTGWTGSMFHLEALDLEALRPYLTQDAINLAIHKFAQAGGRKLRGAHFVDTSEAILCHQLDGAEDHPLPLSVP